MTNKYVIFGAVIVQFVTALFFVVTIADSVFSLGIGPINWQLYEFIQLGAAVGLILGVILGAIALRQIFLRSARAEKQLRIASGALAEVMQNHFEEWGLTPAEKDVALFALKGLTLLEIADLRTTSEGTVKAQTNAIYRKAGVNSRSQLMSLFIEELMQGDLTNGNSQTA